jgi:hypothetical protein
VTCGFDALARPVRVAARSGASWTSLGVLGMARLVLSFDDGVHWRVQEGEREWFGKVVHGRNG